MTTVNTNQSHRAYDKLLKILFGGSQELVDAWWTSANKAFNGRTPEETYYTDKQTVVHYISAQFGGEYL